MRLQSKMKTILTIVACVVVFVLALTDFIYVLKFTSANPGLTATGTPVPTSIDSLFDPTVTAKITKVEADNRTVTVEYEPVLGAAGYIVYYRTGEDNWSEETTASTSLSITLESEIEYEIKVCAKSNSGVLGVCSESEKVKTTTKFGNINVASKTASSITVNWPVFTEGAAYRLEYKETGKSEWLAVDVSTTEYAIPNLKKNTSYDIRVTAIAGEGTESKVSTIKSAYTEISGFFDPFSSVYANICVNSEATPVKITADEGCLGTVVWAEYDTKIYSNVEMTKATGAIPGGTKLTISKDGDGVYVYKNASGIWAVHVSGKSYNGWMDGSTLLIDLQTIFNAEENLYAIRFDRTNAYSSIITVGGNAKAIDNTSDSATRYLPLTAGSASAAVSTGAFNTVKDITGMKLAKYGSKNQMPVIWNLAVELIECQRSALANGYSLKIYEGYRANAASSSIFNTISEKGLLSFKQDNLSLANGYTNNKLIASDYVSHNSNHSNGMAVDVTLIEYKDALTLGAEVEMQTKMHTLDFRSNMSYNTEEANCLYDIMTSGNGITALRYKQEWWHFELKNDVNMFPGINKYLYTDYEI